MYWRTQRQKNLDKYIRYKPQPGQSADPCILHWTLVYAVAKKYNIPSLKAYTFNRFLSETSFIGENLGPNDIFPMAQLIFQSALEIDGAIKRSVIKVLFKYRDVAYTEKRMWDFVSETQGVGVGIVEQYMHICPQEIRHLAIRTNGDELRESLSSSPSGWEPFK